MRYDLKPDFSRTKTVKGTVLITEDVPRNLVFWIECSVKDLPESMGQLRQGFKSGKIRWQNNHETTDFEEQTKGIHNLVPLVPDYTTQKPIRHNVNWPPPWES